MRKSYSEATLKSYLSNTYILFDFINFSYQVYEDVSVSQQRRGGGGYIPQESYENADQFRHPGLDHGLGQSIYPALSEPVNIFSIAYIAVKCSNDHDAPW